MRKILFLHPSDNIAVCLADLTTGEILEQDGRPLLLLESIARGHKVATRDITKGEGIIKYGERMGHATCDIKLGEHVHTHNILGDRLSTEQA